MLVDGLKGVGDGFRGRVGRGDRVGWGVRMEGGKWGRWGCDRMGC